LIGANGFEQLGSLAGERVELALGAFRDAAFAGSKARRH
jgi:hypothetical protein